jgi:CHAT domain-containing protein
MFLAGCPNLIAPLWEVHTEAASAFVKEFYKQYRNLTMLGIQKIGKIAKCVALARNELKRQGDFHYREYAAWTVWGIG